MEVTVGVVSVGTTPPSISTVLENQPAEVPPTLTFVELQAITPPFVSCPATSAVASAKVCLLVIKAGAVSRLVSMLLCPAKPATQEEPVVLLIVTVL
jgi:hypothetical protein